MAWSCLQLGGLLTNRLRGSSYLCLLRLHEARIVRNDEHVVAIDGDADRVLKPTVEQIQHDIRVSVRLDDLGWLSAQYRCSDGDGTLLWVAVHAGCY